VTESSRTDKGSPRTPSHWDFGQIAALLKTSLQEIQQQETPFFGSLSLEVTLREGSIETVAVQRRQTFKN
jgi:hypothetical protein